MSLPIARTVADLRARIAAWRRAGETVALVPTMGALHAGHLSLVAIARAEARRTVASLFVNPTQFGPNEDLARYPRREAEDAALLADAGADLLYAPTLDAMYPRGFATAVAVKDLTDVLCGPFRPGHFQGVATVVTKLLLQALPDAAVFGEKDWQQLQVIRRLAADLDIPVRIVGAPTVREADGLAMSSRNQHLSEDERRVASTLNRVLRDVAAGGGAGAARQALLAAGFARVDYVEVRDAETLGEPSAGRPARVFGAAWLGTTRLIDNVPA